jgi:uncharacterized membrane protein (DUF373 family)
VAAFQCVTTWLNAHPYLLEDKETLLVVLEVVEMGISGIKSQASSINIIVFYAFSFSLRYYILRKTTHVGEGCKSLSGFYVIFFTSRIQIYICNRE